ncbi:hypothetical protein ABZ953_36250 [Streptomyces sp. NPDC046465]|uniref:hypothetical protein n=1 Tax=Streptomyces sp. NPDC046465 TaxID=3155810 RepID=UPI0033F63D72
MEAADLAARAVEVFIAVAAGAASGVGQGAGTAVGELVRSRLAGTERGRAALARLDADQGSPVVRAEAETVLSEEIEADPELRRQLAVHLSAPSTFNRETVIISRSRVSRSPISVGPLTINSTPGGWAVLACSAVLLLALVVLGVYGGVQVLTSDDSPKAQSRSEGADIDQEARDGKDGKRSGSSRGTRTTRTLTPAEIDAALPTKESLPPGGWSVYDDDHHVQSEDRETGCRPDGSWFEHDLPKDLPGGEGYLNAWFRIYACPSPARAAALFDEVAGESGDGKKFAMPRLGDESVALVHERSKETKEMGALGLVRVGTVVIRLDYNPFGSLQAHEDRIGQLTRLATERVQRALDAH